MITNKEVNRFRDTLFTNNNKDIRRGFPMAGRREELAVYEDVFHRSGPQIVTMSGLLGSGKSFFLNHARQVLADRTGFPEGLNAHQVDATNGGEPVEELLTKFGDPDSQHRCLLELEELDRKGEFHLLIGALHSALEWLSSSRDGLLVVTGDQFLHHPEVRRAINATNYPTTALDLGPLDRDLLAEAISLRLGRLSNESLPAVSDEELDRAAAAILSEEIVQRTLLPVTTPPTGNFREAFGLLKKVADHVSRNAPGISIPFGLLTQVAPRGKPSRTPEMARVDDEVCRRVRHMLLDGSVIAPIETEEIRDIAGVTEKGPELFKHLLQPLVTGQVLDPMGISYWVDGATDPEVKYVGPFLPRQNTILRVVRGLSEEH